MTYTAVNPHGSVTELTSFKAGLGDLPRSFLPELSHDPKNHNSQLAMLLTHMQAINPWCKLWKPPVPPVPPYQSCRVHSIPEWDAHQGTAWHLSVGNEFRCITMLEILRNCLPASLDFFQRPDLGKLIFRWVHIPVSPFTFRSPSSEPGCTFTLLRVPPTYIFHLWG